MKSRAMTLLMLAAFAALPLLLAATGGAAAQTKQQIIEQCKAEVRADRAAFMRRTQTGQSPNAAVRECVRKRMGNKK